MQLVFVHGVATRDTAEHRAATTNRDKLFRELLFTGLDLSIHAPMWGKFVPAIDQRVFETNKGVTTYSLNIGGSRGFGGGLGGGQSAGGGSAEVSIGAFGKQDPVAALDAICAEIAHRAARERRDLHPTELAVFRKAAELISQGNAATTFAGEANADTIERHLVVGSTATYGIGSAIRDAVSAVTDRVRNAASTLGFGAVRGSLTPAVGLFLGDVFVYLKDGPLRQRIRDEVGTALAKAHSEVKNGHGPLVVIGHSMGGVILIDMLMDPGAVQLSNDFSIDALVTVGSQPGFFDTLGLLAPNVPVGQARRKPDCIKHWLNVFDPIDPLAFRTDMIFKHVTDLAFNSVTGITAAHTTYFERPQFYARSRKHFHRFGIL